MSACKRCGQQHPKCTGHNAAGKPCGKAPIKGATVCRTHGGAAPQVKAAAQRRVDELAARREVQGVVRRLGLEVDVDAGDALLRELARTHAEVLYLGRVVAALTTRDDDDISDAAAERSSEGLLHHAIHTSQFGEYVEITVDPRVKLWQEARKHLVVVTAALLRLGLAERQQQLAEQQGAALLEVLYGVLRDLGVDPEGDKAQVVVLRHLSAVAG